MRRPAQDFRNGVIEGYVVYYSEKSSDAVPSNEMQMTTKRGDAKYTTAFVRGLKPFSFYQFEVVAYTSAGEGNRTYQFVYIQTFEDGNSICLIFQLIFLGLKPKLYDSSSNFQNMSRSRK